MVARDIRHPGVRHPAASACSRGRDGRKYWTFEPDPAKRSGFVADKK
jgi:hypothetical protein